MHRVFDLFVPGRVCLFGEHSDWAGAYRRFNSKVAPGLVLLTGTNQGVHGRAKAHRESLIIHSTLPDGGTREPLVIPMERDALLREAESGGFYSYAAGVAYYMLVFYDVAGLELDNYRTTLPVKKGLSSSAAFCVLVARAFNRVYDLKLTTRAEMEAAYQGEILTPSRCGRMDQGCAFGQVPVLMTFDGDLLKTRRVSVGGHIPLLVADLNGHKDTIRILSDLNRAYPFATDDMSLRVRECLGPINLDLVKRAALAVETGDGQALGALMTEAQALFDSHLAPVSPEQLASPKLHRVLADPQVQALVHGGKGVGSQGDGCVQFVARSEAARDALSDYLTRTYGMECFSLDLKPPQTVRKAVIPAAGLGTRMFPASRAVKKELFPIVTPDGVAKPIIMAIVEEAVRAGIEEIALIVRAGDEEFFRDFFCNPPPAEFYSRLPEKAKRICHEIQELGARLTFIPQAEQAGFGHAVHCARDWIGNEPFLLLLGDHVYWSTIEASCSQQLIDAFAANGRRSVIGLYEAEAEEVVHYGTVTGQWIDEARRLLDIGELAEKPSVDYARSSLTVPGLDEDRFLCVYGQYVLTPAIFEHLRRDIEADSHGGAEIQLTTALESLRQDEGMLGCIVAGEHYDTGLPENYVNTLAALFAKGAAERRADA